MLTIHRPVDAVNTADIVPPGETYVNNLTLLFELNKLDGGLTEAQLSMIKSREWNNPYFWSAFVLQGEPR